MTRDPFLLAVVWGSVALVGVSTVVAWRQRPKPGATAFAVAMLAATWWAAAASIGLFSTDAAARVFWAKVEWAGVVAFPVAWLVFATAYTGRSDRISGRSIGLLSAPPAVTLALALTNGLGHRLLYRSTDFEAFGSVSLLYRSFGPWFWVHVGYSTLLLVAGGVLVVQLVADRRPLYRGQATALVLVVAAPLVGRLVYVSGLSPVTAFDPTPYTFVISGAAGLAALTQFSFLDAVPVTNRVARRSVVENVDAGVLVTDTDGHVVDANPRARELLAGAGQGGGKRGGDGESEHDRGGEKDENGDDGGENGPVGEDEDENSGDGGGRGESADGSDVVGEPIPDWLQRVRTDPRPDADDGPGETVTTVDQSFGRRHYEVRVTVLTDGYGAPTGRIYLLRDVTDRQRRLQRLNVLNRVLRHNLRNEMTVVYGLADSLARGDAAGAGGDAAGTGGDSASDGDALAAGDPSAVAATIRTRASDLVDLADKAREVDSMLDSNDDRPPTDVCRVVAIERDRVADEWPGVSVSVTTPDEPVFTDGVAGPVVRNLVENAAVHNTADDPQVWVTVTVDDDRATIAVEDDGPGIPQGERAPLDAGLETQLDHASGLGLWIANWGASSVGGDLDVADRDPTGARVTVTLPIVEPPARDGTASTSDSGEDVADRDPGDTDVLTGAEPEK